MQTRRNHCRAFLSVLALLVLPGVLAVGQGKDRAKVRIRNVDLDVESIFTPKFQAQSSPYAKSEYQWLQLLLTYEVSVEAEEWVDRLAMKWHVALTPESGKPLLLNATVQYVDVEAGVCHAVMYVRPGFIRRYYGRDKVRKADVLVHVEFEANGSSAGEFNYAGRSGGPERWWQATSPNVVECRDELLPRNKTPFAAVDYDFYEHIRE